ncbi:hypothetical protein LXL04_036788 [Taraxacum kok-saghyz]
MDKYMKVEQKRPEKAINANEIRITTQGLVSNYISIATNLLQVRGKNEIILKGMGQAISKTVSVAEIVKVREPIHFVQFQFQFPYLLTFSCPLNQRYFPQLHQETEISSVFITDIWEPIEEGLMVVEQTRHVSMISITLSIKDDLDKTSPGYQAPIPVERNAQYNNNYQQPKRYNSVNDQGSHGGKYKENRDVAESGVRGRRGGYENNGYGNQGGGGGRGGISAYRDSR